MYVYIKSEKFLYTTGHYSPDGRWHPDMDFDTREAAAERVSWLNGSEKTKVEAAAPDLLEACKEILEEGNKQVENGEIGFGREYITIPIYLITKAKAAIDKATGNTPDASQ